MTIYFLIGIPFYLLFVFGAAVYFASARGAGLERQYDDEGCP